MAAAAAKAAVETENGLTEQSYPLRRVVGALAILTGMALTMGCGVKLSGNPIDETPNKLPVADTGSGDSAALPGDGTSTGDGCACLQPGMVFRFDNLQIKSLDGNPDHLVIGTLNPLWKGDIDKHELNFFLEIKDVSETELQLRIVNGARMDKAGNVCALPVTSNTVTMQRNGCKLKNLVATGLNVYAGTPANPKNCTTGLEVPHAIPVRNAFFEAEVAPGCGRVQNGVLTQGTIGKESLDNTCTCLTLGGKPAEECGVPDAKFAGYPSLQNEEGKPPQFCKECCKGCNPIFTNLKELLVMFGELQYKCSDDKGKPGVCLSALFEAPRIDKVPVDCPL